MENLIDKLYEQNLLWFTIGAAISADNNYTNSERMYNIQGLKALLEDCDSATIPEKCDIIRAITNGISLLENKIKTEKAV